MKDFFHHLFHPFRRAARRQKAARISFASFLLGFVDAFYAYVLSIYFVRVTGTDNVSPFYFAAYAVIFALLWFMHRIMRRLGGSILTFFLSLLGGVVSAASLSVLPVGWPGAILAVSLLIFVNIAWVALDVALEQVSDDGVTGRLRGRYLTVMNAGILLAPFFATTVVDRLDFGGIFFGVTLGFAVLLATSIVNLRNCEDCDTARMEVRSAWRKMLKDPNLFRIYVVSFALGFFYFVTMIYTPILLVDIGFDWERIGILLTIMLIPFVILQYPLGVLADKHFGEKEFLMISIGFAAVATLALSLFSSKTLLFWGVTLFVSRIGAAGIEVLRDSYFYKHVDGGDDDLIAFFRTAYPLANIVGALLVTPLLLFFPLRSVFFLATLVLLVSLYAAFRLKDTR